MLRHGIVEILLKLPLSINQSKQASKQASNIKMLNLSND
jgi:hypothetical protein